MIKKKALYVACMVSLLFSCAGGRPDNISNIIANRALYNNKVVTVSGILREKNRYYNLFSGYKRECIGLLLTDGQKEAYKTNNNRRVMVSGTLRSEGCGREGICVEHLCGPTIMTGVTISR